MSLLEFTVYGAALIEHCLIEEGFPGNVKTGAEFDIDHGTATSLLIYNQCSHQAAALRDSRKKN